MSDKKKPAKDRNHARQLRTAAEEKLARTPGSLGEMALTSAGKVHPQAPGASDRVAPDLAAVLSAWP